MLSGTAKAFFFSKSLIIVAFIITVCVCCMVACVRSNNEIERYRSYDRYLQYKYMQGQNMDFPVQVVVTEWQLRKLNVIDLTYVEIVPAAQYTVVIKAKARTRIVARLISTTND